VLRTALQPRWLGLLGVVLVLVVVFGWLGHWQLDVARSKGHHTVKVLPRAPLAQVAQPQQAFRNNQVGRLVTVTGVYDAGRQVLVAGKTQGGHGGFWVLTALRTPGGALVPVLRGWSPAAGAIPAPATGPVTLTGTLEPADPAPDGPVASLPAGQIPAADTADVVNLWGGPIYNALVYADAAPAGLLAVPVPPVSTSDGLALQNAAYALQWWVFAAFVVLFWWKMVRQDIVEAALREASESTSESTPESDPESETTPETRLPVTAKGPIAP
jgi:surfeit locus 1 family protein